MDIDPLGVDIEGIGTLNQKKEIISKYLNDKSYHHDRRLLQLIFSYCKELEDTLQCEALYEQLLQLGIAKYSAFLYLHISNFYETVKKNIVRAEHILRIGISYQAEPVSLMEQKLEALSVIDRQERRPQITEQRGYSLKILGSDSLGSKSSLLSFEEVRANFPKYAVFSSNLQQHNNSVAKENKLNCKNNQKKYVASEDSESPFLDSTQKGTRSSSILEVSTLTENVNSPDFFMQEISIEPNTSATSNCINLTSCIANSNLSNTIEMINEDLFVASGSNELFESNNIDTITEDHPYYHCNLITLSGNDFEILSESNHVGSIGSPLARLYEFLRFCQAKQNSTSSRLSTRKSVLPRKSFSCKSIDYVSLATDVFPFRLHGTTYRFVQEMQHGLGFLIQEFPCTHNESVLRFFILYPVFVIEKFESELRLLENLHIKDHLFFIDEQKVVFRRTPFLSPYSIKDVIETSKAINDSIDEIVTLLLIKSLLTITNEFHHTGYLLGSFSPESIPFIINDNDDDGDDNDDSDKKTSFFTLAFSNYSNALLFKDNIKELDREKSSFSALIEFILDLKSGTLLTYSDLLWNPLLKTLSSSTGLFGPNLDATFGPIITDILDSYQGFPSPISRLQRLSILLYEL